MICYPGICSRNRLWKKKVFSIKLNIGWNRLYEVMQENKNGIAQERADLQELISDISIRSRPRLRT